MPTAARFNDKGARHDGYHETVITPGSPRYLLTARLPPEPVRVI